MTYTGRSRFSIDRTLLRGGLPSFLVAALLLTVAAPAGASSLAGTLSSAMPEITLSGNVAVKAYTGCAGPVTAQTTATAAGGYAWTIGGLDEGSYCLHFEYLGTGPFLSEYYLSARQMADATPVGLGTDEDVTGLDADLDVLSSLSGTVTSALPEVPLTGNVAVRIFADCTGAAVTQVTATAAGGYAWTLDRLQPASYCIFFEYLGTGPFVSEYYADAHLSSAAELLPVGLNEAHTGKDAALEVLPSISGRVESAWNTIYPLTGDVAVKAYADCSGAPAAQTTATAAGGYAWALDRLPPGSYCLYFEYLGTGPFLSEYYGDARLPADASRLDVEYNQSLTGNDGMLDVPGNIRGTVSAAGGPISGTIVVELWSDACAKLAETTATPASGYDYRFDHLATGNYRLQVVPPVDWKPRWYPDASTCATAGQVWVSLNQDTSSVDFTLAVNTGSISGQVTAADGGAISGTVWLTAYRDDGSVAANASATSANGFAYQFTGLPRGDYRIRVQPPSPYLDEYYRNQPDLASATQVAVLPGQDTPGVDIAVDRKGAIAGQVSGAPGTPALSGSVTVTVRTLAGTQVASASTDPSQGYRYRIGDLEDGSYKVQFQSWDAEFKGEWYNDKQSEGAADPVAVTMNHDTTGVDAVLGRRGSISGRVTDAGGSPLSGTLDVVVHDMSDNHVDEVTLSGPPPYDYRIGGLATGSYKVMVRAPAGFSDEWYDDKPSADQADPVGVTEGSTTTGIDFPLDRPGGISGAISGIPFNSQVRVDLYDAQGQQVGTTVTGPPQLYAYSFTGLKAGVYYVQYVTDCPSFDEWYDNKVL
jgi:hypothetical protein